MDPYNGRIDAAACQGVKSLVRGGGSQLTLRKLTEGLRAHALNIFSRELMFKGKHRLNHSIIHSRLSPFIFLKLLGLYGIYFKRAYVLWYRYFKTFKTEDKSSTGTVVLNQLCS